MFKKFTYIAATLFFFFSFTNFIQAKDPSLSNNTPSYEFYFTFTRLVDVGYNRSVFKIVDNNPLTTRRTAIFDCVIGGHRELDPYVDHGNTSEFWYNINNSHWKNCHVKVKLDSYGGTTYTQSVAVPLTSYIYANQPEQNHRTVAYATPSLRWEDGATLSEKFCYDIPFGGQVSCSWSSSLMMPQPASNWVTSAAMMPYTQWCDLPNRYVVNVTSSNPAVRGISYEIAWSVGCVPGMNL